MKPRITCTRRLTFCAGHRVMGHENKCAHLHGHNYVVEVTATAVALDNLGRVIDFSVLKKRLGDWLDLHWDHGFILHCKDDAAAKAIMAFQSASGIHQKVEIYDFNPTAENLAAFLLNVVCPKMFTDAGITITKIVLHETENCSATAEVLDE